MTSVLAKFEPAANRRVATNPGSSGVPGMPPLPEDQALIDHGADVNAPAAVDEHGFGGQTPIFHTTVTLGPKTDTMVKLLLRHGADPEVRATFRKQLAAMGDPEKERMHEYNDATAIEFARAFQEPRMVNEAAIAAIKT